LTDKTVGTTSPLVWTRTPKDEYDDPETYSAATPAHRQFYVNLHDDNWTYNGKPFVSREEAQDAAQLEFDRIISSIFTPSVKPLEWAEDWGGSNDDIPGWRALTPWGRISISVAGHRGPDGKRYDRHADAPAELVQSLQREAEYYYQAKVLSALAI